MVMFAFADRQSIFLKKNYTSRWVHVVVLQATNIVDFSGLV